MKHHQFPQAKNPNHIVDSRAAAGESSHGKTNFAPTPAAVAKKAYFIFLNEGSQPGHAEQHWLAAEAQLQAEQNTPRAHAIHSRM